MIEVRELTKRYRGTTAVDGLTFTVEPGRVTGFLGPNGAGKTTTIRVLLGLARPTSGRVLVDGRRYTEIRRPLHRVGALLDADAVSPGLTAHDHLRWLARSNAIAAGRVAAVLEQVGLAGVARTRVGGFSLGMKQRLGIAAALLGDPRVLVFDEPVNGLDPDGIRWIRGLLRSLAAEGRTVLLSSHLMSEMAMTAEHLVIVGDGRLVADTTVRELTGRFDPGILVRTPRPDEFAGVLRAAGAEVAAEADGGLGVKGLDVDAIGDLAHRHSIPLYETARRETSLEDAYLRLTAASVRFRGHTDNAKAA
ncbi:ABC transporter ATP-binding protein [Murinocardiopsis flavida]|nr:ATP-binding cassette domain-containing protein [Murinocardiopsis flavida]